MKPQFSLAALLVVVTAACFLAWGLPRILPPALAIIRDGNWLILAAVTAAILLISFGVVRAATN